VTTRFTLRILVSGVSKPSNAECRVGPEGSPYLSLSQFRPVRYHDHPGVDAPANSHATSIANRHPSRSLSRIKESGKNWPIRDCVTTIKHSFGFT
jgi:hypothetical protein